MARAHYFSRVKTEPFPASRTRLYWIICRYCEGLELHNVKIFYTIQDMAPKKGKPRNDIDSEEDGEEYRKKRDRNNMAVKRSRQKSKIKTAETMHRVNSLKSENTILQEKINQNLRMSICNNYWGKIHLLKHQNKILHMCLCDIATVNVQYEESDFNKLIPITHSV
ncbi:hypothetical protein Trydic_g2161 [Trypoxylus dichotomus]